MSQLKQIILIGLASIYVITMTVLVYDLIVERETKREFIAMCDINQYESTMQKQCVVKVDM